MPATRVKVKDNGDFQPREWLRREVLWASLMSPYEKQYDTWLNGLSFDQYAGNVTRQEAYDQADDPESQAVSFFNQGKRITSSISSAVLFKVVSIEMVDLHPVELLGHQTETIDKVLGRAALSSTVESSDEEVYETCTKLVRLAERDPSEKKRTLLDAQRVMIRFAGAETANWLERAMQNEEGTLPLLYIPDGGHPRSAGERVETLQPVFKQIIASRRFKA